MLTEIEQQNLDIDWFFVNENKIAFVASGGGKLPNSIAKLTEEKSLLLVSYFRNLEKKNEVIINPELDKLLNHDINDEYLNDFIYMAERGLYAFDKTVLNNFSESNYHLVVAPINPLNVNDLPTQIKEVLLQTTCNCNLESVLSIDITNIE
ncbi:hypothetical protein [Flavobacterium sp. RS13.1]|uniref:hypothetical protein n=1 Tax=Flavobacterium sp. RS13.1 TaxID=3400345 RepID=UPI003AAF5B12